MTKSESPDRKSHPFSERMTVNKIEAARRQLATALQLSFAHGDPVSIHLLAYTSHDLIHRLFRKRGFKDDLVFDTQIVKDEYRADWAKSLKEVPNFFKHANRGDENETITFSPAITDLFLLMSIYAIDRMQFRLTPTESAFLIWFALHFPSEPFIKSLAAKGLEVDRMAYLTNVSRAEFFKAFLRVTQKGNKP
jgi:hypothetical protein